MADHVSSFDFYISGKYDEDRLKQIIDNAFDGSEYGVTEYLSYNDDFNYSSFRFQETPAQYGEYRTIAKEIEDSLIREFKKSNFSIHARWSCLAADGLIDYECEYKNGRLTVADVNAPNEDMIFCPDCGEYLEIHAGDLYGIESFRNHSINGDTEWECPECGRTFDFEEVCDLIKEVAPDNSYDFY